MLRSVFRPAIAALLFCTVLSGCRIGGPKESRPLHVLMIGNSYSISCMQRLPKVAESMGVPLDLASMCIGGCSLEKHWANCEHTERAFHPYYFSRNTCGKFFDARMNLPAALELEKWDVVTIQQCSHLSWRPESFQPYADNLIGLIRKLAPQAKIYVQETWSYTPWDKRLASWKIDQDEMYRRLSAAYAGLAARHKLEVIHTGTAVQEWRRRLPVKYAENSFGGDVVGGGKVSEAEQFKRNDKGEWVPDCDVFHLNPRGEYFQALVWAAKLLDADLSRATYRPPFVTEAEAALMRQLAEEVR